MRSTENDGQGAGTGKSSHRKLFKSPKVNYFIEQFAYDRNKSVIENERARAMYDRRFQYYNEVKEKEKQRKPQKFQSHSSHSPFGHVSHGGSNSVGKAPQAQR